MNISAVCRNQHASSWCQQKAKHFCGFFRKSCGFRDLRSCCHSSHHSALKVTCRVVFLNHSVSTTKAIVSPSSKVSLCSIYITFSFCLHLLLYLWDTAVDTVTYVRSRLNDHRIWVFTFVWFARDHTWLHLAHKIFYLKWMLTQCKFKLLSGFKPLQHL